jgi:hypothetical protein
MKPALAMLALSAIACAAAAVGCRADDFDVVERLQPQLQALRRQRFVIDQYGPDAHSDLSPVS